MTRATAILRGHDALTLDDGALRPEMVALNTHVDAARARVGKMEVFLALREVRALVQRPVHLPSVDAVNALRTLELEPTQARPASTVESA